MKWSLYSIMVFSQSYNITEAEEGGWRNVEEDGKKWAWFTWADRDKWKRKSLLLSVQVEMIFTRLRGHLLSFLFLGQRGNLSYGRMGIDLWRWMGYLWCFSALQTARISRGRKAYTFVSVWLWTPQDLDGQYVLRRQWKSHIRLQVSWHVIMLDSPLSF